LKSFLSAVAEEQAPQSLFEMYYEQGRGVAESHTEGSIFAFPDPSLALAFDDTTLDPAKEAWMMSMGDSVDEAEYMNFTDREVVADEDMSD
jgi:hypothetical protein